MGRGKRAVVMVLVAVVVLAMLTGGCGTVPAPAREQAGGRADTGRAGRDQDPRQAPRASAQTALPPARDIPAPTPAAPVSDAVNQSFANDARTALQLNGIDVASAQVADGRAKGGERVLIVSFRTAAREGDLLDEIFNVLKIGYVLTDDPDTPPGTGVDSVAAIAGDQAGTLLASATARVPDIRDYCQHRTDARTYGSTWTWGPGWKPDWDR